MATVYRVLDAVLDVDTRSYLVTVQVNVNNTGNQVFTVAAPRIDVRSVTPDLVAQTAAVLLAGGMGLNTLRNQSYSVG